jgi:predicted PurR-regulated permease PerM
MNLDLEDTERVVKAVERVGANLIYWVIVIAVVVMVLGGIGTWLMAGDFAMSE